MLIRFQFGDHSHIGNLVITICFTNRKCRLHRIRLVLLIAGSAWLSQMRQWSTTSLIGVSGGALLWPAINLSRISRSQAVCPISPNAFTASISKVVAKFAGSSPVGLILSYIVRQPTRRTIMGCCASTKPDRDNRRANDTKWATFNASPSKMRKQLQCCCIIVPAI